MEEIVDSDKKDAMLVWRKEGALGLALGSLSDIQAIPLGPIGDLQQGFDLRITTAPLPKTPSLIRVSSGQNFLSFQLQGAELSDLRQIVVPPGTYDLTITAPGRRPYEQSGLRVVKDKMSDLGVVRLKPMYEIEGRVSSDNGEPLPGVVIRALSSDVKPLAVTETGGHFLVNAERPLTHLIFDHPAFASLRISLPVGGQPDRPLEITLKRGGSLKVTVVGLTEYTGESADVILFRDTNPELSLERYKRFQETRRSRISATLSEVVFERVPEGMYQIVIKGKGPFEQMVHKAIIEDGAVTDGAFLLVPKRVSLDAYYGDEPILDGSVTLRKDNTPWEGTVRLDPTEGVTGQYFWDHGIFSAEVTGSELTQPFRTHINISEEGGPYTFLIPRRRISGTVVDCETGNPISDASIAVESKSAAIALRYSLEARPDGSFDLTGVTEGSYRLTPSSSRARSKADTVEVLIHTEDEDRTVRLPICLSDTIALRIVNEAGNQIPEATVFHEQSGFIKTVDTNGVVRFPLQATSPSLLFIFSPGRTFTFYSLERSPKDPTIISVASATSTVTLRTMTRDHEPIGGAKVVFRYGGQFIPLALRDVFEQSWGTRLETLVDGTMTLRGIPPGVYEFWAVKSIADVSAVTRAGANVRPQAVVNVPPFGSGEVSLFFDSNPIPQIP